MTTDDHPRKRTGKTKKDRERGHIPGLKNRKGCNPHCSLDKTKKPCSCALEPRGHLFGKHKEGWVKQVSKESRRTE